MTNWERTPKLHNVWMKTFLWMLATSCTPMALASDWVQWRGNALDGISAGNADWENAISFNLDLSFKKALGSGYSSISIKDQFAITMATLGDGDFVIAFDANKGTEVWRYRLEDFFLGENGADDGPISTPTIDRDRVYAMSARGRFVALSLKDGKRLWHHDLEERFGGEPGSYGRATSPVVYQNTVFMAVGGSENRTLAAFDRENGSLRWTTGIDDRVLYHTPIIMKLSGKTQCLVPTYRNIVSVAPETGEILWQKTLEHNHIDSQVVPIDDTRFVLASTRNLQLFELKREKNAFKATQIWESIAMKRTHGAPVFVNGYLYGFNSSFLTCVDVKTGKSLWKNRKPGGKNLIAVGHSLLFWDLSGNLIVAKAQPEGFLEQGRVNLTEPKRVFSPPSFANGRVYLRDLEHLYAVRMSPSSQALSQSTEKIKPVGIMAKLQADLAEGDSGRVLREFKATYPEWPIQDKDGWVHFLFEGKVEDIAIVGDMTGGILQDPLYPISGTDLFFRSYRMEAGNRWEYRFQQFEDRLIDPKNPNKVTINENEKSVIAHKNWRGFTIKEPIPSKHKGKLVSVKFKVKESEAEVEARVYLPASYQANNEALPFVMVSRGKEALEFGHFDHILDEWHRRGLKPLIFVFLLFPENYWYGRSTPTTSKLLKEQVLPELSKRFSLSKQRHERVFLAQDWSASSVLRYLLITDSSFGKLGFQSPCFGSTYYRNFIQPNMEGLPKTRFVFRWGRYDQFTPHYPLFIAEDSKKYVAILKKSGHEALGNQHPGGHGWIVWQSQLNAMLMDLFPEYTK